MKFTAGAVAVAIVAAGAFLLFRRAPSGALNPASPDNVVYQGLNSIVQTLTGDKNQTAGGWVHDVANPRAGLAGNEYSPAPGIIVTNVAPRIAASNLAD